MLIPANTAAYKIAHSTLSPFTPNHGEKPLT